ncbi:MAG: hypothetical protein V1746_01265 [bacterium]
MKNDAQLMQVIKQETEAPGEADQKAKKGALEKLREAINEVMALLKLENDTVKLMVANLKKNMGLANIANETETLLGRGEPNLESKRNLNKLLNTIP